MLAPSHIIEGGMPPPAPLPSFLRLCTEAASNNGTVHDSPYQEESSYAQCQADYRTRVERVGTHFVSLFFYPIYACQGIFLPFRLFVPYVKYLIKSFLLFLSQIRMIYP